MQRMYVRKSLSVPFTIHGRVKCKKESSSKNKFDNARALINIMAGTRTRKYGRRHEMI